jgi:hypothetical protein
LLAFGLFPVPSGFGGVAFNDAARVPLSPGCSTGVTFIVYGGGFVGEMGVARIKYCDGFSTVFASGFVVPP